MSHVFFVHSWRTFYISLSIIRDRLIKKPYFLCCRGFFSVIRNANFSGYNLDVYFSIPYTYSADGSKWAEARDYACSLRTNLGTIDYLYIPHVKDPMMQFLVTALRYKYLDFIEEGCLFPRSQLVIDQTINAEDFCFSRSNNQYFCVPSFKFRSLLRNPEFFGTNDNNSISGIKLNLLSDSAIRNTISSFHPSIKTLDSSSISPHKVLHHIGTKDECNPNLLRLSLSIANHQAQKLGLHHFYYGHPSFLTTFDSSRWTHVTNGLNCKIAPPSWLIEAIIFSYDDLSLIGDSSTLMVTATRLGHKYFHIYDYLKNYLPERPAHIEDSVRLLIQRHGITIPLA